MYYNPEIITRLRPLLLPAAPHHLPRVPVRAVECHEGSKLLSKRQVFLHRPLHSWLALATHAKTKDRLALSNMVGRTWLLPLTNMDGNIEENASEVSALEHDDEKASVSALGVGGHSDVAKGERYLPVHRPGPGG